MLVVFWISCRQELFPGNS